MKKIIIGAIILIIITTITYFLFWLPQEKKNILHLVPNDAVFILTSTEPVSSWNSFSKSDIWRHLKASPALAYFSREANSLDSLIEKNDWVGFMGDRELHISTHLTSKGNQYLYLVDLGKSSDLNIFNDYLQSLLGESEFKITKQQIGVHEITEIYFKEDRETLYLLFHENVLLISYYPPLIESAIQKIENPNYNQDLSEVSDLSGEKGLFRVFINYDYLPEYINNYIGLGNTLDWLSSSLSYSGLSINIDGKLSRLTGYTNYNAEGNPYVQAIHNAGTSEHEGLKVFPQGTPYFVSVGFKSMTLFMEELEAAMQKDSSTYISYKKEVESIESFLDINLYQDLYKWMGGEVSVFQNRTVNTKGQDQLALLISLKDPKEAKAKMLEIQKRIKKKTPVKIQSLDYQGFNIQYLAMKGLFRPFFGGMFTAMDKPYFVILDEWLLFSSHPQTLKQIIDHYVAGKTLYNDPSFNNYYNNLPDESAVFCYLSLPNMQGQLSSLSNAVQAKGLKRNQEYFNSFTHISFQLLHEKQTFKTLLNWKYEPQKNEGTIESFSIRSNSKNENSFTAESYEDELKSFDKLIIKDLSERKYEEFYDNGSLKYEIKLRDGWKHGSFEAYYENGEKKYKGRYKNDLKEGTWKLYNVEGDLIKKFDFEEGKLILEEQD